MFYGSQFNSDISGWDVRNGRDFSMMFAVSDFNQDISSWNPENAEYMYAMFQGSKFCQDISSWRLPRRCKTTQMMYTIGKFPDKFAPRLKNKVNEDFLDDIDRVKSSRGSIAQQLAFEGAIQSAVEDVLAGKKPSLDLQALTSVYKPKPDKFGNDIEFHNLIHNSIKIWGDECSLNWIDTSGITDFTCLFEWGKFNGDISKWDTSSARKMTMMFRNNKKFNGDISGWDVSNVEDMQGMFMYASSFNQDISGWDVRNLKYMDMMFMGTTSFDRNLSGWKLESLDKEQQSWCDFT